MELECKRCTSREFNKTLDGTLACAKCGKKIDEKTLNFYRNERPKKKYRKTGLNLREKLY